MNTQSTGSFQASTTARQAQAIEPTIAIVPPISQAEASATVREEFPASRRMPRVGGVGNTAPRGLALPLALLDLIIVLAGAISTGLVLHASPLIYLGGTALWWVLVASFSGYSRFPRQSTSVRVSLSAAGVYSFVVLMLLLLLPDAPIGPRNFVLLMVQCVMLSVIGRRILRGAVRERVLVVTAGEDWFTEGAVDEFRVDLSDNSPDLLVTRIARQARLAAATVVEVEPDSHLDTATIQRLTWELRHDNITLRFNLNAGPVAFRRTQSVTNGNTAALEVLSPRASVGTRAMKRLVDIVGGAFITLLLSPILLVLAILVKTTSTGKVLYRQERIGQDSAPFMMIKFRTMVENADDQLAELLAAQGKGDKPLFKIDNDPRMTRVGAILRKYSLDELPQLFNVIGGSMSLVGPRPQRQPEVELYDTLAAQRLGVRPGMTGLWQVSGRSRLSWEEAIALDVNYAHNWSVTHDLSILLRTVKAVVSGDGAQ